VFRSVEVAELRVALVGVSMGEGMGEVKYEDDEL